jgi:phosphate transport system substrate-binding protein
MIRWLLLPFFLLSNEPVPEIPKPPTASPEGVVRIWGNPQMQEVAQAWKYEFEHRNPDVNIELHLTGSDVGMAALYTGTADIALLGRDATLAELKAFEWIFRYRPTGIPISRGSKNRPGQSPRIAVLVHPSNPLKTVSTCQLKLALMQASARWSDLGGTGSLADEVVKVHMPSAESGTGRFIRERLAGGDIRLDWTRMTEFSDSQKKASVDNAIMRTSHAIVDDPAGLAFGISGVKGTKELPVVDCKQPIGPALSAAYVYCGQTLERITSAFVNRAPNALLDSETERFLEFAVSEEGQTLMVENSDFQSLKRIDSQSGFETSSPCK